jgi:hypothetical protein
MFGLATVGFAVLTAAAWCKKVDATLVQTVVLAGTAVIILWYTVETARIRREAEIRAERDREPRVYFEVQQPDARFPGLAQTSGPTEFVAANGKRLLRFHFINQSPNSALAVVRSRLKMGSAIGAFPPATVYGGAPWQITPFFRIAGVFDLLDLLRNAKPDATRWPSDSMVLGVQVDLYWPNRQFFCTVAKEYHLRLDRENALVELWPEVSTRALGIAPCLKELPEGPTEQVEDASV